MRDEANSAGKVTSILVTGASGGLGRALALHHAQEGVEIHLWGRSKERLQETFDSVSAKGAKAQQTALDLIDGKGAVKALREQDEEARFDLAYLVAGIGDTRLPSALVEDPELVLRMGQINFTAPAAMATALASRMAERGHGRIVLIGSAAANHSLPFATAYSGSKAGLARFADALRLAMKPHGVSVMLAKPGFINTQSGRVTGANRPFELPVEIAAKRIAQAAERNRGTYVTPWPFAALKFLDRLMPRFLRDRILSKLDP